MLMEDLCISISYNTNFKSLNLRENIYNKNRQCFGSGETAHLVFRVDNCSLLVDLPVYFISGSDFEAVHVVIMPAR